MDGPYIALYAGDPLNPGNFDKYYEYTKGAGWTAIILSFLHVSNDVSDPHTDLGYRLYFNKDPIVQDGKYLPHFGKWNDQLVKLKQNSSITKIYLSIGGGYPVVDFQTIQTIYKNNGDKFDNTLLAKNLIALRAALPAIDGIDMDCEDSDNIENVPAFTAFCKLVSGLKWSLTAAPYENLNSFWIPALKLMPGLFERMNLQSGAANPKTWVDEFKAIGINTDNYIVLGDLARYWDPDANGGRGDWGGDCPPTVKDFLRLRRQGIEQSVSGGFIYNMDWILNPDPPPSHGPPCELEHNPIMEEYVDAVREGMKAGATVSK
jgi:hypothetical protein